MQRPIFVFLFFILFGLTHMQAQSGKDILDTYIEKSGGKEAWNALKGTEMSATLQKNQLSIILNIYNTKAGKQAITIDFQGSQFTQLAFNGNTFWTTNLTTMKPEKGSQELADNAKLSLNDFPSPLVNYKKNGYDVKNMGKEIVNNEEVYRVKLVEEPIMINGERTENVNFYYFDTTTYLPVKMEVLQPDGNLSTILLSDYQKVQGLWFPFTVEQDGNLISIKSIIIDPEIDDALFEFPGKKQEKKTE